MKYSNFKLKSTFLLFTLFLVCLFAFSSCNKDTEPENVPATSTGENTMGFYVDGKLINIKGAYERGGILTPSYGVQGSFISETYVYLYGVSSDPKYSIKFNLPIDSIDSFGEYRLHRAWAGQDETSITDDAPLGGNHYFTTDEHDGMIKFTRRDEHVIAGTFEFEAFSKDNGKVISVTEGRFDIKRK